MQKELLSTKNELYVVLPHMEVRLCEFVDGKIHTSAILHVSISSKTIDDLSSVVSNLGGEVRLADV